MAEERRQCCQLGGRRRREGGSQPALRQLATTHNPLRKRRAIVNLCPTGDGDGREARGVNSVACSSQPGRLLSRFNS